MDVRWHGRSLTQLPRVIGPMSDAMAPADAACCSCAIISRGFAIMSAAMSSTCSSRARAASPGGSSVL